MRKQQSTCSRGTGTGLWGSPLRGERVSGRTELRDNQIARAAVNTGWGLQGALSCSVLHLQAGQALDLTVGAAEVAAVCSYFRVGIMCVQ